MGDITAFQQRHSLTEESVAAAQRRLYPTLKEEQELQKFLRDEYARKVRERKNG